MLSHFSWVQLFLTLWTVAHQVSVHGILQAIPGRRPCPPPGDLPDPGIEPATLVTPASQVDFTSEPLGKPQISRRDDFGHRYCSMPLKL